MSLLLAVWFAAAAPDLEAAKRYFDAGSQAYRKSRYDAAIAAFDEAYRIAPRPALAFSLAQALRLQYYVDRDARKLVRAIELYQRYLAEEPDGRRRQDAVDHLSTLEPILLGMEQQRRLEALRAAPQATQLMVATEVEDATARVDDGPPKAAPLVVEVEPGEHEVRIEAVGYETQVSRVQAVQGRLVVVDAPLTPLPARLSIQGASRARIAVDGRPVGKGPLDAPLTLPAGPHFITAQRTGRIPAAAEVELGRGDEQSVQLELRPTAQRKWAWGTLAASGALAAAGGITLGLAVDADGRASELDDRLQTGPPLTPDERAARDDAISERNAYRAASIGLLGAAAVAAVTSTLLFVLDRPPVPAPSSQGRVAWGVGPGSVVIHGTF